MVMMANKMVILILLCVAVAGASRCPGPEWFVREGTNDCYYVDNPEHDSTGVAWNAAKRECEVRGGALTGVYGADDMAYLKARMHNMPGISGFFGATEEHNFWISLAYQNNQWIWTDTGRPFVMGDLGPNFNPSNQQEFLSTVDRSQLRGVLSYDSDGDLHPHVLSLTDYSSFFLSARGENYICKANYSAKPLCKTEEGWEFYDGRCWQYHRELANWDRAREVCSSTGAYLAVPSSDSENRRLNRWAERLNVLSAWIGVRVNKTAQTTPENTFYEDGQSIATHPYKDPWTGKNPTAVLNGLAAGSRYCGNLKPRVVSSAMVAPWTLEQNCNDAKAYACESGLEKCPYGWYHFAGFCYSIFGADDDLMSWQTANQRCGKSGAYLAVVTGVDVNSFLAELIDGMGWTTTSPKSFWLGYKGDLGVFSWATNGDQLGSTIVPPWAPNQPVIQSQTCAYMQADFLTGAAYGTGLWGATTCDSTLGFICQASVNDVITTEVIKEELICEEPFIKYHDMCYYFSGSTKKSWFDASTFCNTQHEATLVEIHSGGENAELRQDITGDTWIGFKRVLLDSSNFYVQYAGGKNVSSTAYTNYQTNTFVDGKYCYFMRPAAEDIFWGGLTTTSGKWDAADCTEQKPFVCGHRGTPTTAKPPAPGPYYPECGEGWTLLNNTCYQLRFPPVPFSYAFQVCQGEGPASNMLYIENNAEEKSIQDLINGRTSFSPPEMSSAISYWTALQVTNKNQWYWKYRDQASIWYLPMAFSNWAPGQPNPQLTYSERTPQCSYLRADGSAQWEASSCSSVTRSFICKKPALLRVATTPNSGPPAGFNFTMGCRAGWQENGGQCFHRNHSLVSWNDARTACQAFGGKHYLAEIQSSAQQSAIANLLADAWIGLHSIAHPSDPREFAFVQDSSRPLYTPWSTQLARPTSNENCVAATRTQIAAYNCDELKPYVCMTTLSPVELDADDCVKPPQDRGCRRWGYGHREKCYYMGVEANSHFGTRELSTFDAGRSFCQTHYDGDLALVKTQDIQEFLTSLLGSWQADYWIGLREASNPWNAFKKWVDNSTVSYTNWAHSEPHISHQNIGCVAMHSTRSDVQMVGDWYVDKCDQLKFAVCEASREGWTPPTAAPTIAPTGCPRGWSAPVDPESRHCYQAWTPADQNPDANVDPMKLTWQEAENSCQNFGGHLASIASREEHNHVKSLFKVYTSDYNYWIGLKEQSQNIWRWSDDTPFGTTTFWHPTTDHSGSDLGCAAMEASSGNWISQNCNLGWGWICEIPRGFYNDTDEIHQVTLPSPTVNSIKCPYSVSSAGDWYYENNTDRCYFVSKAVDTWDNAEGACNRLNSNLASINEQQQAFLTTVLSRYVAENTRVWIGLRLQDYTSKQHGWTDRTASANRYRNWDTNEPNPHGVEACVSMDNRNGKWKDDYCQNSKRYVCIHSKIPVVAPTLPPVQESWGCPTKCPKCTMFRDNCYYFSEANDLVDWSAAEAKCVAMSDDGTKPMHLISIHDAVEQAFVTSQLAVDTQNSGNRWLGLQEDSASTNKFFYSDHTPVDFTNWYFNEPNYHPQRVCTEIQAPTGRAGRWNDDICTEMKGYICKTRRDSSYIFRPTAAPDTACIAGYSRINGACFRVKELPNGGGTREAAHSECLRDRPLDGRLASVLDIYENSLIQTLLAKAENYATMSNTAPSAWIGLQDKDGQLMYPNSQCYATYNAIDNFYNNPERLTRCVKMEYHGRWSLDDCTSTRYKYAVCEYRPVACQTVPHVNNGYCPSGFRLPCSDFCYNIEQNTGQAPTQGMKRNIDQARAECRTRGGSLLSVRNEADQVCLENYISHAAESLWLGLQEKYDVNLNTTYKYKWVWDDPEVTFGTYTNWSPNEPSGAGAGITWQSEQCVEILTNGLWNNVNCGFGYTRGFICEAKKIPFVDPTATSTTSTTTTTSTPTAITTSTPTTTPTITPSGPQTSAPAGQSTTTTQRPPLPGSSSEQPPTPQTSSPVTDPDGSTLPTSNPTGTEKPVGKPEAAKSAGLDVSTLGAGSIAGIAITVLFLVPALTFLGYYLWKRKNVAYYAKSSRTTFRRADRIDEEPVVQNENYDSYT